MPSLSLSTKIFSFDFIFPSHPTASFFFFPILIVIAIFIHIVKLPSLSVSLCLSLTKGGRGTEGGACSIFYSTTPVFPLVHENNLVVFSRKLKHRVFRSSSHKHTTFEKAEDRMCFISEISYPGIHFYI